MPEPAAQIRDIDALKSGLKATWSSGDFGKIAEILEQVSTEFVERLNLRPGEILLDVACGTGNSAIPAGPERVRS